MRMKSSQKINTMKRKIQRRRPSRRQKQRHRNSCQQGYKRSRPGCRE